MEVVSMAEVLDSVQATEAKPDEFVSRNGLKLKLKKVNRMVVVEAGMKVPLPKIPRFYNKDKDREEENPNHPDYVSAMQEATYKRGMMAIGVYLSMGTEIRERPVDINAPDDTDWSDDLDAVGIEVPAKGRGRYLAWLKYYALEDDEINDLTTACMRFNGFVTEGDVKEIQSSFRG